MGHRLVLPCPARCSPLIRAGLDRPTEVKTGIFDNEPNPAEELWGLYLSRALPPLHANVDLYYLGYDHKSVRYVQGTGREQREMRKLLRTDWIRKAADAVRLAATADLLHQLLSAH